MKNPNHIDHWRFALSGPNDQRLDGYRPATESQSGALNGLRELTGRMLERVLTGRRFGIDGNGAMIVLSGEPGLGKSHLLNGIMNTFQPGPSKIDVYLDTKELELELGQAGENGHSSFKILDKKYGDRVEFTTSNGRPLYGFSPRFSSWGKVELAATSGERNNNEGWLKLNDGLIIPRQDAPERAKGAWRIGKLNIESVAIGAARLAGVWNYQQLGEMFTGKKPDNEYQAHALPNVGIVGMDDLGRIDGDANPEAYWSGFAKFLEWVQETGSLAIATTNLEGTDAIAKASGEADFNRLNSRLTELTAGGRLAFRLEGEDYRTRRAREIPLEDII